MMTSKALTGDTARSIGLNEQEMQCLTMVAEGKRTLDICNLMLLSEIEVERHLSAAEEKLGARNRMHAVSMALLMGTIGENTTS